VSEDAGIEFRIVKTEVRRAVMRSNHSARSHPPLTSVAYPHHVDANPNPNFHFDTDLDPAFHFDADPDPISHQSDADPCDHWSADSPRLHF
jgi:hypothetical protein